MESINRHMNNLDFENHTQILNMLYQKAATIIFVNLLSQSTTRDIMIKETMYSEKIFINTSIDKLLIKVNTGFKKEAIDVLKNILDDKVDDRTYLLFSKYYKALFDRRMFFMIDPNLIEALINIHYNKPYVGRVHVPNYNWSIRNGLYIKTDLDIDSYIDIDTSYINDTLYTMNLPTIFKFLLSCSTSSYEEIYRIYASLTIPVKNLNYRTIGHVLRTQTLISKYRNLIQIEGNIIADFHYFEQFLCYFILKNSFTGNLIDSTTSGLLKAGNVSSEIISYLNGTRNRKTKNAVKKHRYFKLIYNDDLSISNVIEKMKFGLEAAGDTEEEALSDEEETDVIEEDNVGEDNVDEEELEEETEDSEEENTEEENTEDDNTIDENDVTPEEKMDRLIISSIDLEIPKEETLNDLLYKWSVCRLVNGYKNNPPNNITSEELLLLEYWCRFWIGVVSASNTKQLLSTIIGENAI